MLKIKGVRRKKQGNGHAKTERRGYMLNGCSCQNRRFLGMFFISASILFSSPEPKAPGDLIV